MLTDPVLVLNRSWTAVTTTTVKRALVLLFRGAAHVVCPLSYEVFELPAWLERAGAPDPAPRRVLRTPTRTVEQPEVILLAIYGGLPRTRVAFSRKNLFRRDEYCCQYCGRRRPPGELSIDHVVPRSRGGPTSWENCVLACVRCNARKANKAVHEAGLHLRRQPAAPAWSPLLDTLPQAQPTSWQRFLREGHTGRRTGS